MNKYRMMTIEKLFETYQFENGRGNKSDAMKTKVLIQEELYRRLRSSIRFLEEAETEEEAKKIYNQFLTF